MADQYYDLFFNGQLLEGYFLDFVKADIQNLFKADDAYIDKLFSGQEQAIKLKVDKPTAIKFQQAFKKSGAKLIVKAHNPSAKPATVNREPSQTAVAPKPVTPALPPTTPQAAQPAQNQGAFSFTNEPVAGESASELIEHHQPDIKAPETTPHWEVSAPGSTLTSPMPFEPVNVDTSGLSVVDAGENLIVTPAFEEPAPVVNIDAISLAPEGGEIETLDDKRPPVQVDISHLSVE